MIRLSQRQLGLTLKKNGFIQKIAKINGKMMKVYYVKNNNSEDIEESNITGTNENDFTKPLF